MSQYYVIYQENNFGSIEFLQKFAGDFQAVKQLRQIAEEYITRKEGTNHVNFYHETPKTILNDSSCQYNKLYLVPCSDNMKKISSDEEDNDIPSGILVYKKNAAQGSYLSFFSDYDNMEIVGKFSVTKIPKMSTEITTSYVQVPTSERNTHTKAKIHNSVHEDFAKELCCVIVSGNPFEGRKIQKYNFKKKNSNNVENNSNSQNTTDTLETEPITIPIPPKLPTLKITPASV